MRRWSGLGFGLPANLAQCRSDVSAVDRSDVSCAFQFQCLVQKGVRHILGSDFTGEQIAAEILFFAQAAGFRALESARSSFTIADTSAATIARSSGERLPVISQNHRM